MSVLDERANIYSTYASASDKQEEYKQRLELIVKERNEHPDPSVKRPLVCSKTALLTTLLVKWSCDDDSVRTQTIQMARQPFMSRFLCD